MEKSPFGSFHYFWVRTIFGILVKWSTYHLNKSGVVKRHFFTLKIDSETLGTKRRKILMVPWLWPGRKVLMVLGLFSKTEMTSQVIYAGAVKIVQTFKEIWGNFQQEHSGLSHKMVRFSENTTLHYLNRNQHWWKPDVFVFIDA